jgi:RimJ/RimL family protein N-acetyltransferase
VLRSHTWLAWDGDTPVGFLGGEIYDRWTTWDGSDPDHAVVHKVEEGPAMGSAYVVDPARWRQGYGTAILRAWVAAGETADVRIFALGVDGDNTASARCAETAGFAASSRVPDWEDTVYFLLRR